MLVLSWVKSVKVEVKESKKSETEFGCAKVEKFCMSKGCSFKKILSEISF